MPNLAGFSRMRSEGFPFIVGGLGVGAMFAWRASSRRLSSSLVVSRRLSSFVVVVAYQIRCHWGKLLQVTVHGCVTCQFAPLFHCDLHDHDMSRKKRDAIRCTGRSAVCCAIPLGLAFGESCFWGVGCGRAIGICVAGCGIEALFS